MTSITLLSLATIEADAHALWVARAVSPTRPTIPCTIRTELCMCSVSRVFHIRGDFQERGLRRWESPVVSSGMWCCVIWWIVTNAILFRVCNFILFLLWSSCFLVHVASISICTMNRTLVYLLIELITIAVDIHFLLANRSNRKYYWTRWSSCNAVFRLSHRLYWLRFFMLFLRHRSQIPGYYLD
jgi:hypothetical protein